MGLDEIKRNFRLPIDSVIDHTGSYGEGMLSLLNRFCRYPQHSLQVKILASIFCLNTHLEDFLPLVILHGESRSGKSTTGKLLARMHGLSPLGSCTVAAVKRVLNANRYVRAKDGISILRDAEGRPIKSQDILILEDVDSKIVSTPALYQLLKVSRDRSTSTVVNASTESASQVEEYDTFSLALISTIEDFHSMITFEELNNRAVHIYCERWEEPLDQLEEFDWVGFARHHATAWSASVANNYFSILSEVRKPKELTLTQWQVSRGSIVSGSLLGVFSSIEEGVDTFRSFFDWRSKEFSPADPYEETCRNIISSFKAIDAVDIPLTAGVLTQAFKRKVSEGVVPIDSFKPSELHKAMKRLGYRLDGNFWIGGK